MAQSYADILRRAGDNSRSEFEKVRRSFFLIEKNDNALFSRLKKNVENVKN